MCGNNILNNYFFNYTPYSSSIYKRDNMIKLLRLVKRYLKMRFNKIYIYQDNNYRIKCHIEFIYFILVFNLF